MNIEQFLELCDLYKKEFLEENINDSHELEKDDDLTKEELDQLMD